MCYYCTSFYNFHLGTSCQGLPLNFRRQGRQLSVNNGTMACKAKAQLFLEKMEVRSTQLHAHFALTKGKSEGFQH